MRVIERFFASTSTFTLSFCRRENLYQAGIGMDIFGWKPLNNNNTNIAVTPASISTGQTQTELRKQHKGLCVDW